MPQPRMLVLRLHVGGHASATICGPSQRPTRPTGLSMRSGRRNFMPLHHPPPPPASLLIEEA